MTPSSIAFLCHPYHRGGVTQWMVSAAKEFAKQGIKTYFVTVAPKSPFISSGNRPTLIELLNETRQNIEIIAPVVGFEFELGTEEHRGYIYKKSIIENIPQGTAIILSDDPSVWLGAALVSKSYPMIGVIHSSVDPGYFLLTEKYQSYLSSIVCVSNRTKINLFNKVPNLKIETHVIPCGISLDKYKSENLSTIPNNLINIIWIGRFDEISKRVSDIPLIGNALKRHNIPFKIKVIGNGDAKETLLKAITEYELQNVIQLTGWLNNEQVIKEYKASDLLLQTSNYEGMSVAVMEALAAGCGVVSSRVSGVEDYEYSEHAQNCLGLYETGNIEEAVSKIISVSNISREKRLKAARRIAEEEFSITACINKYLKVIALTKPGKNSIIHSSLKLITMRSLLLSIARLLKYKITKSIN